MTQDPGQQRVAAARGAVLRGVLLGDCLGVPTEGGPPSPAFDGQRLHAAMDRPVLRFSDDTQLTLALARHLATHPAVAPAVLVQDILAVYESERGYGAGMRQVVAAWRAGSDLASAARVAFPEGSLGNGAAMRVAPVALRWPRATQERDDSARRSAALTHAHPIGIDAAIVQAAAVAAAWSAGRFGAAQLAALADVATTAEVRTGIVRAGELLTAPPTAPAAVAQRLGTAVTAHRSVPAALWCAARGGTVVDAVSLALDLGGDTDTIAVMAGAVAAAASGVEDVDPAVWDRCEEGIVAALDEAASALG